MTYYGYSTGDLAKYNSSTIYKSFFNTSNLTQNQKNDFKTMVQGMNAYISNPKNAVTQGSSSSYESVVALFKMLSQKKDQEGTGSFKFANDPTPELPVLPLVGGSSSIQTSNTPSTKNIELISNKGFDSEGRVDWELTPNSDGTESVKYFDDKNQVTETAIRTKNTDGTFTENRTDAKTNAVSILVYDKDGKVLSSKALDTENRADWESTYNSDGSETIKYFDDNNQAFTSANRTKNADGTFTENRTDAKTNAVSILVYDKDGKVLSNKALDTENRADWELTPNSDGTESVKWFDDNNQVTYTAIRTKNADGGFTDKKTDAKTGLVSTDLYDKTFKLLSI
jgi:predicted DNA-binding WGR domain protein